MKVILTGGLGFIGSHTSVLLSDNGFTVIIVDNLSNAKIETLERIKKISKNPNIFFEKCDVTDKTQLANIFSKHDIEAVIHFASLKSVNESIANPLIYYKENLYALISVLEVMKEFNCKKLIFSSSATVYGTVESDSFREDTPTGKGITNPYGKTKYFQEEILADYSKAHPEMMINILRYFNPVGAHPSGLIGEDPKGIPNNIFPYILKVASREYDKLSIFGNNYDTEDGTCIRDFIHVMDLADGHYVTLKNIIPGINTYNLGTGKGTSILQLVNIFEKTNDIKINYEFADKRSGDVKKSCANVDKIYKELGWKTKYTIEDVCRDGYNYTKQL